MNATLLELVGSILHTEVLPTYFVVTGLVRIRPYLFQAACGTKNCFITHTHKQFLSAGSYHRLDLRLDLITRRKQSNSPCIPVSISSRMTEFIGQVMFTRSRIGHLS